MSNVEPVSLMSQLCARPGLMVARSAPSNLTSVSYVLCASRVPLNSYTTPGSSEIRSLRSEYQTSVPAAPPADAVGLAPALPLAPGVVAGPQAPATSSAAAKKIEVKRSDLSMECPPLRVVDEPSTGSIPDLTRRSRLLILCRSSGGGVHHASSRRIRGSRFALAAAGASQNGGPRRARSRSDRG